MAKRRKPGNSKTSRSTAKDERVFKALANADRRTILDCLRAQAKTTGQLCELLAHLDRCTVMLHLRNLEEAELVISKKQGRFRWNYLNVEPIQRVYNRWIKDYAQPAADLLTRLKDQLEA